MPWTLLFRFAPYIVGAIGLSIGLARFGYIQRNVGYQERWGEDFVRELHDDMGRAKLADDALWRTRISEFAMLVSSITRENAYARYQIAAESITDGLSDRVWAAERRASACAVSTAGSGGGAAVAGTAGAESLGRLHALEQAAFDACGRDGAALEALGSRPICECSRP
jgi:hypothetical protein